MAKPARVWDWGPRRAASGRGLYLGGGFGVGKTHLLAGAFHAASERAGRPGEVAFVQFQELTSVVGQLGMSASATLFRTVKLLCIDEFELDDPGNLHLIGTFLSRCIYGGMNVMTTSNTPPNALGQGRFNAALFSDTLSALASHFESVALDGPNHRQRDDGQQALLTHEEYAAWLRQQSEGRVALLTASELHTPLEQVHPAVFGELLRDVDALGIEGLVTLTHPNKLLREQGAVRFVHFMDKVYDLGISTGLTGVPLPELFEATYRTAAFGRKYSRCLSRLAELTQEASRAVRL